LNKGDASDIDMSDDDDDDNNDGRATSGLDYK